jgi:hypothetical protein
MVVPVSDFGPGVMALNLLQHALLKRHVTLYS